MINSDTPEFDRWLQTQEPSTHPMRRRGDSLCLIATHDEYRKKENECVFWMNEAIQLRQRVNWAEDELEWFRKWARRVGWGLLGVVVAGVVAGIIILIGRHL